MCSETISAWIPVPFTLSVIDIHSMDAQKSVPNPFQNVNAIFATAALSSQGFKSIKIIIIPNKILSSLLIIFIKKKYFWVVWAARILSNWQDDVINYYYLH